MTSTPGGRQLARRLAITAALGALLLSIPVSPALAAKRSSGGGSGGSTSTSSSMTLVMVTDKNGNGAPNWNDTITWQVSTTATSTPGVRVKCYQGTTQVYSAQAGYYTGYLWPDYQLMTLASGAWLGGGASCIAELYYFDARANITVATSTSFSVGN